MRDYRRYAVFFAPRADSALWRFGSDWLGWDAAEREACPPPRVPGLPLPQEDIVARPRKYGFHATLKAPFRLADERDITELDDALSELALITGAFDLPALQLAALGRFLALVPEKPDARLDALAAECVRQFDGFRAPAGEADRAARRTGGLDAVEAAHLRRWGYPYVLDRYRFHLTMTGPLQPAEQAAVLAALERPLAPVLAEPVRLADVCLFGEAEGGAFHLLKRYALAGAEAEWR